MTIEKMKLTESIKHGFGFGLGFMTATLVFFIALAFVLTISGLWAL